MDSNQPHDTAGPGRQLSTRHATPYPQVAIAPCLQNRVAHNRVAHTRLTSASRSPNTAAVPRFVSNFIVQIKPSINHFAPSYFNGNHHRTTDTMALNGLRKMLSRSVLTAEPLPVVQLDQLRIPKKVLDISVTGRDALIHAHMLEHFVAIKTMVEIWAVRNLTDTESAWTFYINMAIKRLVQWLEASLQNRFSLEDIIPPLDVLLVWHALLQYPTIWDTLVYRTRIDFGRWNQELLLRALLDNVPGRFKPPPDSIGVIQSIYETPDLYSLLDVSHAFLSSDRPDHTTQHLADMFLLQRRMLDIQTLRGNYSAAFDFHGAVDCQLRFAGQMLRFSWHHMYSSEPANERQFGTAIERYRRFMALTHFAPNIHTMQSFVHRQSLDFVPTLDIDLIWRTHMLAPRDYRWFCDNIRGNFLVHIPSPTDLGNVDRLTSQIYQHVYEEDYDLCLCWPCVAGRRGHAPGSSHLKWLIWPAAKVQSEDKLYRRRTSIIGVPLEFNVKQCSKCGSHPQRGCRQKDKKIHNNLGKRLPSRSRARSPSSHVPTSDSAIFSHPVTPMWTDSSLRSSSEPGPSSRPAAHMRAPQWTSTQPSTITLLATPGPSPSNSQFELQNSSASNSTTPSLSNGSTYDSDNDKEYDPKGKSIARPLNQRPATPAFEGASHPPYRNVNVTRHNMGDTYGPRHVAEVEPGEWLGRFRNVLVPHSM
ncbi:hypothetical protein FDECE_9958 [Fusarium decemcellulare]|nr:hypothetical protein FDECE_9958 [Fusarium decemcellulare]